ncbi:MAG: tRNA (adenosine(37)-N6)-threonylcarbamoyltransferase complex dimerization subunit type 1 TsaB [Leptospiraceae bacterium]|nr:tRNA (adenosine(37)-N6)-threonylcarbamoyltransferase complex dimerization subunit type 1 TsaB [Leptospiraceae bacterium]MDW7977132.1 tRNA (adenosine(37)-N6)-threonylcarbamoyltransferase complex dimerization subunit type 1 TsaB [Leptospiraceae bacterium]
MTSPQEEESVFSNWNEFLSKNPQFKILVLDSSSSFLVCSFFQIHQEDLGFSFLLSATNEVKESRSSFQKLSFYLNDIFRQHGFPNIVLVGVGPGSFTGVRISVSTARNLAQFLRIPVIGIDSMSLYAYYLYKEHKLSEFYVIFDAKQKQVYMKKFDVSFFGNPIQIKSLMELHELPSKVPFFVEEEFINTLQNSNREIKNHIYPIQKIESKTWIELLFDPKATMNDFYKSNYKEVLPLYIKQDPAHQKYPEGLKRL